MSTKATFTDDLRAELESSGRPHFAEHLGALEELTDFRKRAVREAYLSLADRRRVVQQALQALQGHYAHLPHKAAMYAIDPVQRLRLIEARLDRQTTSTMPPPDDFHAEMADVFLGLRDLHTNYLLPSPYAENVAFLPFLVEAFYEPDPDEPDLAEPRYLVTKVAAGFQNPDSSLDLALPVGAEITHWNGMTIDRAVEVNAARYAGSNPAARRARAVESLTVRPLRIHRLPDEDWVVIGYLDPEHKPREKRLSWLVAENLPLMQGVTADLDRGAATLAFDYDLDEANRARKMLYAPRGMVERELAGAPLWTTVDRDALESAMPGVFRAQRITGEDGEPIGHIRIFTFNVWDPLAFVAELARLVDLMPEGGLVLDVRGNGGGHIWAAEMALQLFSPHRITPQPTQLTTTRANRDLCRLHDHGQGGIDLGPWLPSIEQAVETGAPYSNAHPITPPALANAIGQRYVGPVVLVTDARCYSATDIFAAGFQDHGIGPVLGVDESTGAGGANVWTHDLLRRLTQPPGGGRPRYAKLPKNVDLRVSIRRTLRVGALAGTPVEDFGVQPDARHRMTRRDVLGHERDPRDEDRKNYGNHDLMMAAAEQLAARRAERWVSLRITEALPTQDGRLRLTMTTRGIDRVDLALDGRPRLSVDRAPEDTRPWTLEVPRVLGRRSIAVDAYAGGRLVARRHEALGARADGSWGILDDAPLVGAPAAEVPEVVRLLIAADGADPEELRRQVEESLGRDWSIAPLFADTLDDARLSRHHSATGRLRAATSEARRDEAFESARKLARATGWDVQPDLPSAAMYAPQLGRAPGEHPAIGDFDQVHHRPGTQEPRWAIEALRVPAAWQRTPERGASIVVAQPDTGFTEHEVLKPRIDKTRDRDILDDDDDATDPLVARWWAMDNPGHGTSTASVVVGAEDAAVNGSAPGATLVPIRAIRSVVQVFDGDVAQAVQRAIAMEAHVITMSLGGVGFGLALRDAIRVARERGMIVLAAAGNRVRFVVAPASYDEVIAVAATNIDDQPWTDSSRGRAVDVAAPGESVVVARAERKLGRPSFSESRGSGTSFAVALTAGVAALWLEKHGHGTLRDRYGPASIQGVFVQLLRSTARRPAGWDDRFGDGIVDADALLAAELPDEAPPLGAAPTSALERLADFFPDRDPASSRAALEAVLPNATSAEREAFAGEIAYHMSQRPDVYRAMVAAAEAGAPDAAAGAADDGSGRAKAVLRGIGSPELVAAMRSEDTVI